MDEALGALAAEEGEEEVITSVLQDEQRKAVAEEFQKKLEAERAKFEEEMNQAVEAQRRLKEVNLRYSCVQKYLLYWYKSTNTDISRAACQELFAKQEAERLRLEVHPVYLLYWCQ